jgi:hypothetical protein
MRRQAGQLDVSFLEIIPIVDTGETGVAAHLRAGKGQINIAGNGL